MFQVALLIIGPHGHDQHLIAKSQVANDDHTVFKVIVCYVQLQCQQKSSWVERDCVLIVDL